MIWYYQQLWSLGGCWLDLTIPFGSRVAFTRSAIAIAPMNDTCMDTMKSALASAHYKELGLQEACAYCRLQWKERQYQENVHWREKERDPWRAWKRQRRKEQRDQTTRQKYTILARSPFASIASGFDNASPFGDEFLFSPACRKNWQ